MAGQYWIAVPGSRLEKNYVELIANDYKFSFNSLSTVA